MTNTPLPLAGASESLSDAARNRSDLTGGPVSPYTPQRRTTEDVFIPPAFLLARDVLCPAVVPPARRVVTTKETFDDLFDEEVAPTWAVSHGIGGAAATESFGAAGLRDGVDERPAADAFACGSQSDSYAIGLRVLRISPAWLLLSSCSFFLLIFLFSWLYQSSTQSGRGIIVARENNATNQAPSNIVQVPVALPGDMPEYRPTGAAAAAVPGPDGAGAAEADDLEPSMGATVALGSRTMQQPQEPADGVRFTVQTGSYNNPAIANERVSDLRGAGYTARTEATGPARRGLWYSVYVGDFPTREEAVRLATELRARRISGDALVTEIR